MERVSARELAEVLGFSVQRINQLKKDGVLVPEGSPARYDLPTNVQSYVRHVRESVSARLADDADAERKKLAADADYKAAKARQEEIRVAVDAAGKPASEASEIARREACAALEDLSQYRYDPRAYAAMVRERKGWSTDDVEDGDSEAG